MKKIYNSPKFKAIYCKPIQVLCSSGNNGHHYGWDDNPDGPDNGKGHHWGNRNNAPFDDEEDW